MTHYLLIASRDSFEHRPAARFRELARQLADAGSQVTLFLLENAVLDARQSPLAQALTDLEQSGVRVLADDFSLRERGIDAERLQRGVSAASIDVVVDRLEAGDLALWS